VGAEVGAMPARRVALVSAANHAFAPMEFEKNGFTLGFIKVPVQNLPNAMRLKQAHARWLFSNES
jgi:hypothetical protein